MPAKEYTPHQIHRITGADRGSVDRWLAKEGIEPLRVEKVGNRPGQRVYGPEALACVQSHQKKGPPTEANIDEESGLTWAQAKLKEDTLTMRRERKIAEKSMSDEWISSVRVSEIISMITNKLEQIPDKARSELGLSDAQRNLLQRMIDEARQEARSQIREIKPETE